MNTTLTFVRWCVCAALCAASASAQVKDEPRLDGGQRQPGHEHSPLTVRSRPVIERLPLHVIAPADVVSTNGGQVHVADTAGRAVFRVAADGQVALLADELEGLSRICVTEGGDVFALLNSQGSARILQITASGHNSEVAHTDFPAAGLARDQVGALFTTNSRTGGVISLGGDGAIRVLTQLSQPSSDLVLDSLDNPIVLLKSGKVVSVGPEGNSLTLGYVPETADRLRQHPDGFVVALGNGENESRKSLWKLTADRTNTDHFAALPEGTSAFAFDGLGNLVLANPDLRAVTRVTSRFRIPCPHCAQPVTMIFSTATPPETSDAHRSF